MTHEEAKAVEKRLRPCRKCGGKLQLNGYENIVPLGKLGHVAIRCRDCGSWHGGFAIRGREERSDGIFS